MVREDHPRVGRRLTLRRYVDERHVLVSTHGRVRGNVDLGLEKVGKVRDVAFTLPHFLVAPAIIRDTDYIVTLPERVARRSAELGGIRLPKPPVPIPGFDVSMARHERSAADRGLDWLTGLLRQAAAHSTASR